MGYNKPYTRSQFSCRRHHRRRARQPFSNCCCCYCAATVLLILSRCCTVSKNRSTEFLDFIFNFFPLHIEVYIYIRNNQLQVIPRILENTFCFKFFFSLSLRGLISGLSHYYNSVLHLNLALFFIQFSVIFSNSVRVLLSNLDTWIPS